MDNIVEIVDAGSRAPSATPSAVIESPHSAIPQPPCTNSVLEATEFLNQFFLAMQIPAIDSTEELSRTFRHNQGVMLHWIIEANETRRLLERHAAACIQMHQDVEERVQYLEFREELSSRRERDALRWTQIARAAEAAEAAVARVDGERFGGRLRRTGRALRSIFRRTRRQGEDGGDDNSQVE